MKIGCIGLGNMGAAIAANVLHARHEVAVWNRSAEKARSLIDAGATLAANPRAAASDREIVMTMLADDAALESVLSGADGLLAGLRPGALHISMSTISVATAERIAASHGARGQHFLCAPVFGRPDAAAAAKLFIVAAGAAADLQKASPLFGSISQRVFYVGETPSAANLVKLCGNFMIASMLETFSEAYATLRKAGVDPHLFLETMNALFASPVYANYGKIIADETFQPAGFALRLGLKDMRLVLETAQECTAPMPLASHLRDRFLSAVAQGQGELDWSSVARISARAAGL